MQLVKLLTYLHVLQIANFRFTMLLTGHGVSRRDGKILFVVCLCNSATLLQDCGKTVAAVVVKQFTIDREWFWNFAFWVNQSKLHISRTNKKLSYR